MRVKTSRATVFGDDFGPGSQPGYRRFRVNLAGDPANNPRRLSLAGESGMWDRPAKWTRWDLAEPVDPVRSPRRVDGVLEANFSLGRS